ncbi:glycosyltransferase [Endozoicomonas euniceicola]|uniref:Glycosyltransferase n=1 Tax=Endozoicomonas euniceicola TaxID=1234143 RepID=A0ABY6GUG6_9GAMM|nr:glycosyltransferase [Endozoicomonas euniceicola]UYM16420.1 glycosyltransferase [Endozoicomonas euniceicola]
MKRVAVILALYNPDEFFKEQINSILSQRNVSIDVFIFNDQSSSGLELVNEILCDSKNIFLIDCQASGSAGKNFLRAVQGFDSSDYQYVAFSDQDDLWLPGKIERAVNVLEGNRADGYSSNLIVWDGRSTMGELKKDQSQKEFDHYFQGASAGCTYVLTNHGFTVVKETIQNVDLLNLSNAVSHDWSIYFILRVNKCKWVFDQYSGILYRQHDNNVYGANRSLIKKITMVFGSWYYQNITFLNSLPKEEVRINLNVNFFSKLCMVKKITQFRRKKFESAIAYIWWLFSGKV